MASWLTRLPSSENLGLKVMYYNSWVREVSFYSDKNIDSLFQCPSIILSVNQVWPKSNFPTSQSNSQTLSMNQISEHKMFWGNWPRSFQALYYYHFFFDTGEGAQKHNKDNKNNQLGLLQFNKLTVSTISVCSRHQHHFLFRHITGCTRSWPRFRKRGLQVAEENGTR